MIKGIYDYIWNIISLGGYQRDVAEEIENLEWELSRAKADARRYRDMWHDEAVLITQLSSEKYGLKAKLRELEEKQ